MLTHNVLIPTEQAMSRLGWQRVCAGASSGPLNIPVFASEQIAWRVPPGREVLFRNGFDAGGNYVEVLHGKQGLPAKGALWRNADGYVFHADPVASADLYRLRTELSTAEMRAGTTNGVLTPREIRLVNRLTAAEQEMQRLSYLESQLARNPVMHLRALQPHGSASGTLLGEPSMVRRHNTALATARREITAQATPNVWKSAGSLVGSQVLNYHLDREFFRDAPISIRTSVVDGVSPLVVMTRLHWSAKVAVIVGSHVYSRWLDAASRK